MTKLLSLILLCTAVSSVLCQTPSSVYQPGTITAVAPHEPATGQQKSDVVQYDVSVKVENTVYIVLYTPPLGMKTVEYSVGNEKLVLVKSDTLTFNSDLSGKTVVPILRREALPAQNALDWSKAPGEYFSIKLKHLTETLNLSEDQQAKIKPILEQESGELEPYWGNPVISRKDKLRKLEEVVQSSDEKLKPLLTEVQIQKLEELRKEQKQELKKRLAEKPTS